MSSQDPDYLVKKKSPKHGFGVFTLKAFQPGEFIGHFQGKLTSKDGTHVLWVHDSETNTTLGYQGTGILRFLNHSSHPNSEFNGTELYSTREISEGDELVFHYGEDWKEVP